MTSIRPIRTCRAQRRLGTPLLTLIVLISTLLVWPAGATAEVNHAQVKIDGGGWGHGRGMGQYGALGYARDHGWSSRQILDHFYGNTTQGPAPHLNGLNPDRLRVQLAYMNGRYPAMSLTDGRMVLSDSTGKRIRTVSEGAIRFVPATGGFMLQTAASCQGPWVDAGALKHNAVAVVGEADPDEGGSDVARGRGPETLIAVCGRSYRAWYDGEIWAQRTSGGTRTINVVTVEQYLRGVVPNEVPASWPEATLQAQAVAARSYVLAGDRRWGSHADTCDNTYCQVYDGRYTTRGGFRSATHARTDAAVAATAGQVRLRSNGAVARTEFSSSTGGHTAGGDFPAVADHGDVVSANPNSTWTVKVDLGALEHRYGLGRVTSIEVTKRDGHGRFGGRALEVRFDFEKGSRTMSGAATRRFFGLKSDLFDFADIEHVPAPADPDPQEPAPDPDPSESEEEIEAAFVDSIVPIYARLADREPTAAEIEQWLTALRADGNATAVRLAVATELVRDEHFVGALVDDLYQRTLGRRAEQAGRSFWIGQLDGRQGSMSYEQVGTYFFSSPEYYRRSGANDTDYVGHLYQDLLDRPADPVGLAYWTKILSRGSANDVAAAFYRSDESRRTRAAALYRLTTGAEPTPQKANDGAELLLSLTDLELAARYGASVD